MKRIIICLAIIACVAMGKADTTGEGIIGLVILQDEENTTHYNTAGFEPMELDWISISRVSTQEAITSLVNAQDCGKALVDQLLCYSNGSMDDRLLIDRLRRGGITDPTTADIFAAIHNNYVLVVKLTEETISELRAGSSDVKLRGNYYLYALEFTTDDAETINAYLPAEGDDAATLGRKRNLYEGYSIPLTLIDTGTKVDADLPARLANKIEYQTAEKLERKAERERITSPSTAVKVALSPIVIVK